MISAFEINSPSIVTPATGGWYGMPSRRRRLLAKTIEALSAPSWVSRSIRPPVNCQHLHEMVSKRAYYKAERRGFEPGHELADWLEAERELLGVPAYFFD
jgi:hypothetical protein